jgi:hypothetical protein
MFHSRGEIKMSMLKKSLQTLGSLATLGMVAATPLPAFAQAANPCAPKAQKTVNPCAPKAKKAVNPCAPANPCAAKK